MSCRSLSIGATRRTVAAVTAEALDPPPDPAVEVLARLLRTLWPECSEAQAERHAGTLVRLQTRHYGEPMQAEVARLTVLTASNASEPAMAPDTVIELPYGDLFLRPWSADMDRRPKTKTPRWADPEWAPGGPRRTGVNKQYTGSSKHGECTPCGKENVLRQAAYRLGDQHDAYSRMSVCEKCARKMLGGPVVVPQFSSPEEAQAWLDAQE